MFVDGSRTCSRVVRQDARARGTAQRHHLTTGLSQAQCGSRIRGGGPHHPTAGAGRGARQAPGRRAGEAEVFSIKQSPSARDRALARARGWLGRAPTPAAGPRVPSAPQRHLPVRALGMYPMRPRAGPILGHAGAKSACAPSRRRQDSRRSGAQTARCRVTPPAPEPRGATPRALQLRREDALRDASYHSRALSSSSATNL